MSTEKLLGTQVKIVNLIVQREYIENFLKGFASSPQEKGNPAYIYEGYVFPENVLYFRGQGFKVIEHNNDEFLFVPADDSKLSDEELTLSTEFAKNFVNSTLEPLWDLN